MGPEQLTKLSSICDEYREQGRSSKKLEVIIVEPTSGPDAVARPRQVRINRRGSMTPTLVDRIPRERGDGEVWDIGGGYHLLVLPEGETACISGYRTKSRLEGEWLSLQVERIAKDAGLWLETFLGIDVVMVVVGRENTGALLRACAEQLGLLAGADR